MWHIKPLDKLLIYPSKSRPKAERSSELCCQKNKNDQKKTVRRARRLPILSLSKYSLSCQSFYLSLPLLTSKNFSSCSPLPQFIQKTFWEIFFRTKCFFPKKQFSFFFLIFFFKIFFRILFFLIFFFSVYLNSTTSFCILLTKQTKNTLGQNELDQ